MRRGQWKIIADLSIFRWRLSQSAVVMPVSLEQWRAAVGSWNRRRWPQVRMRLHCEPAVLLFSPTTGNPSYRHTANLIWTRLIKGLCLLLLLTILTLLCMAEISQIIMTRILSAEATNSWPAAEGSTGGVVASAVASYVASFQWNHVSIITRALLIISGDVELNPGPSKTHINNTHFAYRLLPHSALSTLM